LESVTIRHADMAAAPRISEVMGAAFQADPISCWLIPDAADRAARQPAFFRVFVEKAILAGRSQVAGDFGGAALWFDSDPSEPDHPNDDAALIERALEEHSPRFQVLYELMERAHPVAVPHAYLAFLAVMPDLQGHGVGSTLLRHRLTELDALGAPAYLEASSARSVPLYQRFGFELTGPTIQLPDGPELYPMWREPTPPGQ
jgi:GNAT superfamily N-acetyltransferase